MPNYLPFAILLCVFSITSVFAQTSVTPTYYKDCSILDFGEQDMSTMTEAEKIQALDDSLFGALNQSEECMNAAAQSSAQSVASAAGQGAGQGTGAGNTSSSSSSGAGAGQSSSQSSTESQDQRIHKLRHQALILPNNPLADKRKVVVQRYVTP